MTSAAYDYCPTITAPGHASNLSGTPPSIHGIIGNDWFDRQKRRSIGAVSDSAYQGVGTTSTNIHVSPRHFIGSNFADQLRLHFGSKVIGISMKDRAAVLPAGKRPNRTYWFETGTGHFISSTSYMRRNCLNGLKNSTRRNPPNAIAEPTGPGYCRQIVTNIPTPALPKAIWTAKQIMCFPTSFITPRKTNSKD